MRCIPTQEKGKQGKIKEKQRKTGKENSGFPEKKKKFCFPLLQFGFYSDAIPFSTVSKLKKATNSLVMRFVVLF